ncbi:hypothetical protein [Caballeronia sp. NK8]|uniref:hypothetical protein n=1 Tax=Caballeronia sp. NK8 TaxID=140098 RepID=UPI001BD05CA2|nr:hypothetical protein [Caballeronia sp. NK8]
MFTNYMETAAHAAAKAAGADFSRAKTLEIQTAIDQQKWPRFTQSLFERVV